MSRTLSLAGFQVTLIGRFGVTTEAVRVRNEGIKVYAPLAFLTPKSAFYVREFGLSRWEIIRYRRTDSYRDPSVWIDTWLYQHS